MKRHSRETLAANKKPQGKSAKGRPYSKHGVIQLSLFDAQIALDNAAATIARERAVLIAVYPNANKEVRSQIATAYQENVLAGKSIAAVRAQLRDISASVAA